MAKFLKTEDSYAAIVDIINKASSKVVLISPYIKIPERLLDRLKYVDKKCNIVVVCRGKDLKSEVKSDLKQLKNLELRFDENLHAKCFYNEETMVIGSLNLYDYSQQNNREMGILLSLKDENDHDIFNEARNEAEFIVKNAKKDNPLKSVFSGVVKEVKSIVDSAIEDEPQRPRRNSYPHTTKQGYCIRCKRRIPYDLDSPYCRTCWSEWSSKGANPTYVERDGNCHTCGRPAPVSKEKPECNSCYHK